MTNTAVSQPRPAADRVVRGFVAVIAGSVVTGLVVGGILAATFTVEPAPAGAGPEPLPEPTTGELLVMWGGFAAVSALGALAGGAVARLVGGARSRAAAPLVGALCAISVLLQSGADGAWVTLARVASALLCVLAAWLGGRLVHALAARRGGAPRGPLSHGVHR